MRSRHGNFHERELRQVIEEVAPEYFYATEKDSQQALAVHPGLQKLVGYARRAKRILESGCGAGSAMTFLWHDKAQFVGVDVSSYAIKKVKGEWQDKKKAEFLVGKAEALPVKSQYFDLVYATYTLEHVIEPEKVIDETIRVAKRGAYIVFVSPNFGSPIEFSPCFPMTGYKPLWQAVKRFVLSHIFLFFPPHDLAWNRVRPKILDSRKFTPDSDTTVEPYLQTLITYLKSRGVEIIEFSSGLEWDLGKDGVEVKAGSIPLGLRFLGVMKKFVKYLGRKGIFPYRYYGPTLFVVGRKRGGEKR